jgi:hypothetical protein
MIVVCIRSSVSPSGLVLCIFGYSNVFSDMTIDTNMDMCTVCVFTYLIYLSLYLNHSFRLNVGNMII